MLSQTSIKNNIANIVKEDSILQSSNNSKYITESAINDTSNDQLIKYLTENGNNGHISILTMKNTLPYLKKLEPKTKSLTDLIKYFEDGVDAFNKINSSI